MKMYRLSIEIRPGLTKKNKLLTNKSFRVAGDDQTYIHITVIKIPGTKIYEVQANTKYVRDRSIKNKGQIFVMDKRAARGYVMQKILSNGWFYKSVYMELTCRKKDGINYRITSYTYEIDKNAKIGSKEIHNLNHILGKSVKNMFSIIHGTICIGGLEDIEVEDPDKLI
jgi:hypothetical protein